MKRVFLSGCLVAATAMIGEVAAVDYVGEILPIMKEHCWDCHSNETEVKGNVALDPDVLVDQIGKYNIIRPGDPAESGFVERLRLDETHNDFMPRKGRPLPSKEIEAIEEWIRQGAIVDSGKPTAEETKRLAEMKVTVPAPPGKASEPGFHSWTNREGKAIEARMMGLEKDSVKLLLRNGKSYVVPLGSLDDSSVALAKKLSSQP